MICKDHAVSVNTFYVWKRKYAGMQTDDVRHLRELERENMLLKKLLAERDLEIDAVKALFRKNGLAFPTLVCDLRIHGGGIEIGRGR